MGNGAMRHLIEKLGVIAEAVYFYQPSSGPNEKPGGVSGTDWEKIPGGEKWAITRVLRALGGPTVEHISAPRGKAPKGAKWLILLSKHTKSISSDVLANARREGMKGVGAGSRSLGIYI